MYKIKHKSPYWEHSVLYFREKVAIDDWIFFRKFTDLGFEFCFYWFNWYQWKWEKVEESK